MEDDEYLVFVEVRFRRSQRYGGALASISHGKKTRLRAAAEHYLQRFHRKGDRPCRFDVVAPDSASRSKFTWIQNAF